MNHVHDQRGMQRAVSGGLEGHWTDRPDEYG